MKRFIALAMVLAIGSIAFAQTDLADFQDGFTTFATDMAATLSYNATIGNNWSDAYIGQLLAVPPHFGVAVYTGATFVSADGLGGLLDAAGIPVPAQLEKLGLPIPAAAASVKIGGFVLPFDIGVKGMIIPEEAGAKLEEMLGIQATYSLFGANVRYAVLKENLLLPDVSVGVGYNRLTGGVTMPLDLGTPPEYTFGGHELTVSQPDMTFQWTTDSFDFTAQASKKILFITPYLGLGLSAGKSTVLGGMKSELLYDGTPVTESNITAIKTAMTAAGIDVSDLSAEGFLFSSENSAPVFRLFGGLALDILVLRLDTMVIYVPQTKGLGLNAGLRIQL